MVHIVDIFRNLLAEHGISLTPKMAEQFDTYYRELITWNEKMNLTGITEREDVYIKHFYDSASIAFFLELNAIERIADVGSGAGFPGLPLKILFPHLRLTIIDSLNKRIGFLNHLISLLELDHVDAIHARAEEAGKSAQYREQFDLVTARAVAKLNVLNEFCLPLVKVGGRFVAMKGTDPNKEIAEAAYSIQTLGAKLSQIHPLQLPDESERHIIVIDKTSKTPKAYPRKPGTPLKQPLLSP